MRVVLKVSARSELEETSTRSTPTNATSSVFVRT